MTSCFSTSSLRFIQIFALLLISLKLGYCKPPNKIAWISWDNIKNNLSSVLPTGQDTKRIQYLARVKIGGNLQIAKYIPDHTSTVSKLYWATNGKEAWPTNSERYQDYQMEVLTYPKGVLDWVYAEGARVPIKDMVPGGYLSQTKETIYICRVFINEDPYHIISGQYLESVGKCAVPWHQEEQKYREHEVLVLSSFGKAIGATLPKLNY